MNPPAVTIAEMEANAEARALAYAEEIRAAYARAEAEILAKVARRIERGIDDTGWAERKLAEIRALNTDIGNTIDDLRALDPTVRKAIEKAYSDGSDIAAQELINAKLADITADIAYTRGTALRTLVEATVNACRATDLRILRTTQDAYRSVVAESVENTLTGTITRRQAAQQALNRFADMGITGFKDKAGRNWDMASYVETATRSATAQASIQGHINKLEANGKDLVIVSDSPEECPICAVWEGKVLSISGADEKHPPLGNAIAAGLFHANCTHRTHLYTEGLTRPMTDTANPEGYKDRQQQRYNERMIRQWKRREAVAIEPQDKALAKAKVREWQARQKKFIDDTGRLRQRERESVTSAR